MANIQKRGDNSWYLTVNIGKDENGKYIRRTKTVNARTKKEAESEYAKFRQEVDAGEYIAPEKMTFSTFVEEWREKYALKHLGEATLDTYMIHLRNRAIPVFGHLRIDAIKTIQIVNFIEELGKGSRHDGKEGNLSPGTIQYIHRAIKNVFSRAVEWKIIKTNPVEGVKKPKVIQKNMEVYDQAEVETLLTLLENEPIQWRVMISLALTTGLRRGELLGLDWKNVDLEKGTIDVWQSLTFSHNGGYKVKEPKTRNSSRKVALPVSMLPELKAFKVHCNKLRLETVELWEGGEHFFLFTSWNGKPLNPYSVGTWWRRFTKRVQLKYIRFHDLRHTSATLLLNQGVHAKIISSRLGHANITTTLNIYAHALQEADQAAADKLDSLFTSRKENKLVT
jgi:integrase